jgi:hypothetical protein
MTIRSRIKKLESVPMKHLISMDSMAEISPKQAEQIYDQVMNGPSPPLFARTRYGRVSFNELTDAEIRRTYKEYADGNFEIITEQEV